jgi:hypothetical protein
VEHDGVRVGPELGDDERHPLGHQAGDEGDIAGQPVELGDDDRALGRARRCKRRRELQAPLEGVEALSGLGLSVFLENSEAISLCK